LTPPILEHKATRSLPDKKRKHPTGEFPAPAYPASGPASQAIPAL